ncbi:MAG: hypothetical protein JXA20_05335 [Spirochaetes bacterium]|nr:hypothetical protein [Spirochaetota bacterium]
MSTLRFQWLDYREHRGEIEALRKKIFVEELNREEAYIRTRWDEEGLHLGTYDGDRLFSITSGFLFFHDDPMLKEWELRPLKKGELAIQVTKRASLQEYRGQKLNELAVVHLGIEFLKVLEVAYYIIAFYNKPTLNDQIRTYHTHFGFEPYKTIRYKGEDWTLIKLEGEERYRQTVESLEPVLRQFAETHSIMMQPLAEHLRGMDHVRDRIRDRIKGPENRTIVFG